MNFRFIVVACAALVADAAFGAELPCVIAERELRDAAADVPASFWQCTRTSRVCLVRFYPDTEVLRAAAVRDLPSDGAVNFGIVQSAAGDQPAVCLVGAFSGGSAAAWLFDGWEIQGGRPVPLKGMDRTQMNSDAVPPRTLGNAIYGAYVKARK
jgi:hypothetical protein